MKNRSIKLNISLNVINTLSKILFPLISFPYVARILGVEQLGKYNYSASIVSYWLLFAMLGINVYSIREGAKIRDDKAKLSQFVAEVFSINVLNCIFVSLIFILIIFFSANLSPYKGLILILALTVPLTVLGTDWLNSIYEDYLYITIRSVCFQVVSIILLFLFVKTENDLINYAMISVFASAGTCVLNYIYTNKYSRKSLTFKLNIKQHFKPILILFTISLAALLYSSSDTIMLGYMTDDFTVGIYSTAAKIYTLFKQLLFAAIVVCLPRFSHSFELESKRELLLKSQELFNVLLVVAIPLVCGIITLSETIVLVIAGDNFVNATITLRIKSFAILIAVIAYFYMQIVLLPAKKDKVLLWITLFSGLFNIVANFIFIPLYKENGAAITTVLSELLVLLLSFYFAKKILYVRVQIQKTIKIFIASSAMILLLAITNYFISCNIARLIIGFIIGSSLYVILIQKFGVFNWYGLIKNKYAK